MENKIRTCLMSNVTNYVECLFMYINKSAGLRFIPACTCTLNNTMAVTFQVNKILVYFMLRQSFASIKRSTESALSDICF